jgi:YHS domain-containing protein
MKNLKWIAGIILAAALVVASPVVRADGTNAVSSTPKPKPDLLTTCPVSGDKLGGDMGKPYVMVYQGQEVKFCCPMCKADFDKDPAKYLKKIQDAAVAAKK